MQNIVRDLKLNKCMRTYKCFAHLYISTYYSSLSLSLCSLGTCSRHDCLTINRDGADAAALYNKIHTYTHICIAFCSVNTASQLTTDKVTHSHTLHGDRSLFSDVHAYVCKSRFACIERVDVCLRLYVCVCVRRALSNGK